MAIYEEQISERLAVFIDAHCEYEETGDAENGPGPIERYYAGPQWAIDLWYITRDWADYQIMIAHNNYYGEV